MGKLRQTFQNRTFVLSPSVFLRADCSQDEELVASASFEIFVIADLCSLRDDVLAEM